MDADQGILRGDGSAAGYSPFLRQARPAEARCRVESRKPLPGIRSRDGRSRASYQGGQRLGFSLRQIEQFAAAYESVALNRDEKIAILKSRLADIDDQARKLCELRGLLSVKLEQLETGEPAIVLMKMERKDRNAPVLASRRQLVSTDKLDLH